MSDDFQSLLVLDDSVKMVIAKKDAPLSAEWKKEPKDLHTPPVKKSFALTFPIFYELNHKDKTKVTEGGKRQTVAQKGTFTRYIQLPGQEKTVQFTSLPEGLVYFIPLEFKNKRQYYKDDYDSNNPKAPDCQSDNGIVPQTNKFANSCAECPHSQWINKKQACKELPTILALDVTAEFSNDPKVKEAVTRELCTIDLSSGSIKSVNKFKEALGEPVLFDDGTYGQIDMTNYISSVTAEKVYDDKGNELTFCNPIFDVVSKIEPALSESLLTKIKTPLKEHQNKTILDLFIGCTQPFLDSDAKPVEEVVDIKSSAPPMPTSGKAKAKPIIEVVDDDSTDGEKLVF